MARLPPGRVASWRGCRVLLYIPTRRIAKSSAYLSVFLAVMKLKWPQGVVQHIKGCNASSHVASDKWHAACGGVQVACGFG